MTLVDIGKTAEGRPMIMAIITSPKNLKKLDRYKQISRRLALAQGLTDAEAKKLAAEGKAVVWIDGGLHATEIVGSPAAHRARLSDGQRQGRRDAPDPGRSHPARRAGQSRRPGARRQLVHAGEGPPEADP